MTVEDIVMMIAANVAATTVNKRPRQELVCEGDWQVRVLAAPPPPHDGPHARITLRPPF